MSKFSDIVDGKNPYIDTIRKGLVYTCRCGWIDLGHARPDNAQRLWDKIKNEIGEGRVGGVWYKVDFKESMGRWGLKASESRSFAVRAGLDSREKESVALGIFLSVSQQFEEMQDSFPWGIVTDSGYSAEDLVSNLIGFYRTVRPGPQYISQCGPVSKKAAESIWTKYGAVGSLKNRFVGPFLFPCSECPQGPVGPASSMLPPFLSLINPAPQEDLYKPWDPNLVWENPPDPPLQLGVTFYVTEAGDSLSKIATRLYGDPYLWPLIFDTNRQLIGPNPNLIRPNVSLLIPELAKFSQKEIQNAKRRGRPVSPKIAPQL